MPAETSPFSTPDDPEAGTGTDEQTGPTLDEALGEGDATIEELAAETGAEPAEEPAPEPEPEPTAEEETEEPAAEPSEDEGRIRYRDPESGQFISAEQAREQGLDPEELQTAQEAADELFEEEEGEEPSPEGEEEEFEGETVRLNLQDEETGEAEPVELEVDDPEVAAGIQELQERAAQAEALEAEVEQARSTLDEMRELRDEIALIQAEMDEDPVPFLVESVGEARRGEVVQYLLANDDDLFEQMQETMEKWQMSPEARERDAYKFRANAAEKRDERRQRIQQTRAANESARQIQHAVRRAAAQLPEGDREMFQEDLMNDIIRHAEEEDLAQLPVTQLAEIPRVRRRLQARGIDPSVVATEPAETSENGRPGVPKARPGGEEEEVAAEEAEKYRKMGEELRKARARRKEAASSTEAGAGAAPGGGESPFENATLEEALELAGRRT